MKNLILLTTSYPFGKNKETFLETEIEFLGKRFDKIFIVATKPDSLLKRAVPMNTIVYKFSDENIIWRLVLIFLKNGMPIIKSVIYEIPKITKIKDKWILKRFSLLLKYIFKAFLIKDYIRKRVLTDNCQYLIYSYWFNGAALAAGLIENTNPDIKTISRLHNWDLYPEYNKYDYSPFLQLKANLLDRLYFISKHGKNYFEKEYKKSEKFKISRLGTCNHSYVPATKKSSSFHIVSCSALHPVKRVDLIIRSLSIIDEIEIKWTHLGGGDLFEELNMLASKQLGGKKNINFKIVGNISNSEVINFYENNYVDLFLNTSISEGVPVSIMEAMSFGIPVIATNVGGTSEIVNSSCGILLDKNCTISDTKSGIIKMYNEYNNFAFRENAHNNWLQNFNAEINYKQFAEEISELI